ncbi:MAG: protein kinase [Pyrinomonadaceae bacterium]
MINDVLGKLVADKYRIESLVSESESGDIYLGRHEVLDRPVTVKILPLAVAVDGRWVTRFVDEARSASGLSHPNILNITDFGTDAKGISYAVFEEAKGKTLDRFVGELPLDEKRSLNIARQIAAAVAAAHAKKIIHGGLALRFVYVDDNDEVKVYGFGRDPMHVARDADPRYLSPEQCNAFPAADERSDVYALGVILYEMLGGVVPYDGATAAAVLAKQSAEPPPPLSAFRRDLHADIEPIVLTAIAADPERRYPTMAAFTEDLELLSGSAKAQVKAAAGDAPQRNIWQTAFIVLAGILLLAVSLIYLTSVKKTDPTTQLVADAGSLPVQPIGPATGAQEESLAKLPAMTEAEITAAAMTQTPDTVPGGDGYNAWANGGAPPAGAPLNQGIPPVGYVPPGGQYYTVDPNGSQFMPPDSGVILVPVPSNTNTAAKATPTPKTPTGNTAAQPTPVPNPTPKPMATPPPKGDKPANTPPTKDKTPATGKPAKNGKPGDPE